MPSLTRSGRFSRCAASSRSRSPSAGRICAAPEDRISRAAATSGGTSSASTGPVGWSVTGSVCRTGDRAPPAARLEGRHRRVAGAPEPPRPVGGDADAHPRPGDDPGRAPRAAATRAGPATPGRRGRAPFASRSSPRHVASRAGPRARSRSVRQAGRRAYAASDPVDHGAGTQQDGAGDAVLAADDVRAPVHAVGEVAVQVAGRAEHDRGPRRLAAEGVRRRVVEPSYASTSVSRTATRAPPSSLTTTAPIRRGATVSAGAARRARSTVTGGHELSPRPRPRRAGRRRRRAARRAARRPARGTCRRRLDGPRARRARTARRGRPA